MADGHLTISAAEAKRQFGKLLRAVSNGQCVTITSYGRPVAELTPVRAAAFRTDRRRQDHHALMTHLASAEPVEIEAWTRDELYERG